MSGFFGGDETENGKNIERKTLAGFRAIREKLD
jgi:hypothetical protein